MVSRHALTVSKVFKMLKLDTIKQKDYENTKIVTRHALTVSKVFMKMLKLDTINQKDYVNTNIVTQHALTVSGVFKMLKVDTMQKTSAFRQKISSIVQILP